MKKYHIVLLFILGGCSGNETNNFGIPPGLNYFTFADVAKNNAMKTGNVIIERISKTDSTVVFKRQRAVSPYPLFLSTSAKYGVLFRLWMQSFNTTYYVSGDNKLKITFPDGNYDILELNDAFLDEGNFLPKEITYNTKLIKPEQSDEPIKSSFVYVLR